MGKLNNFWNWIKESVVEYVDIIRAWITVQRFIGVLLLCHFTHIIFLFGWLMDSERKTSLMELYTYAWLTNILMVVLILAISLYIELIKKFFRNGF